jgi:hypothetical protein
MEVAKLTTLQDVLKQQVRSLHQQTCKLGQIVSDHTNIRRPINLQSIGIDIVLLITNGTILKSVSLKKKIHHFHFNNAAREIIFTISMNII